jgi:hypothetical protein
VIDEKDANKPSLRRTSTSDKTVGTDSDSSDDDRPTLKRRDDNPNQTQQQQQGIAKTKVNRRLTAGFFLFASWSAGLSPPGHDAADVSEGRARTPVAP